LTAILFTHEGLEIPFIPKKVQRQFG